MTLKEFHEARVARITASLSEAQFQLEAAIETLGAAVSDLQTKRAELSQITDDIAATRLAMAEAPLPSDVEGLADQLRDQIIVQRQGKAAVLDAERVLDEAQRAKATASASLASTEAELPQTEADLALAAETQAHHEAWSIALTLEPLSGLPAAAGDALAGEDFLAAEARVEGAELPVGLRTRTVERRALALRRLAGLEGLKNHATGEHDDQQKNEAGPEGEAAELWTAYLTAEKAFGDYVRHAQQRYDQALANLTKINANPPLTTEQEAMLHNTADDTELEAAREAALLAEQTRDEKLEEVEDKQRDLAEKRLEARKEDVDLDESAIDALAEVSSVLDDLASLEAELAALEEALDVTTTDRTPRRELQLWRAAGPEHVFDNLSDLEAARETLTELAAGPGILDGPMTAAEENLAAKLTTLDKSERTRKVLSTAIDQRQASLDYANGTARSTIASQVRGDQ